MLLGCQHPDGDGTGWGQAARVCLALLAAPAHGWHSLSIAHVPSTTRAVCEGAWAQPLGVPEVLFPEGLGQAHAGSSLCSLQPEFSLQSWEALPALLREEQCSAEPWV